MQEPMRVKRIIMKKVLLFGLCVVLQTLAFGQKPRARDMGIPFEGLPGKNNAITDVPGVEVGYSTLIAGEGPLIQGQGPVRTGVTVILPKGKTGQPYAAAWHSLNGDGELTGIPYIEDFGFGYNAIGITNTFSVGVVRDAIGAWSHLKFSQGEAVDYSFGLPIVGETWDGVLNDINGYHVKKEHVWEALEGAHGGKIQEGNVGGGTGMALYDFKGGSGTASRVFEVDSVQYTLGVFIQANFGSREELTIAGVPVGKEIGDLQCIFDETRRKDGSAIVVVITDAPLLPNQLKLVAKRVTHGIARTGTYSRDGSGEIFLAISTAEPQYNATGTRESWEVIPKWHLNPVFKATVEATEEAIINVLLAADDMVGINGNTCYALPADRLIPIMKKYNRLKE